MVRPALGELGWGTWAVACLAIPVAKVPFGSRNLVRITRIPRCSVCCSCARSTISWM
jgi:hypothetical protein